MKKFTKETEGYEKVPAYLAFKTFFDSYLLERNCEKTLSFMEDDFYGFGIGGDEAATNKVEFIEFLRIELEIVKEPIEYNINYIQGKEVAENVWNIFAGIEVMLPNSKGEKIPHGVRFTGCFKLSEKGFVVTSAHLSEVNSTAETRGFLPVKYVSNNTTINKAKTEQIVFDIMSKAMPGGIISGYAEEGFPLYFVNERYLELLGYSSYEEYYEEANGLGITHIHPDDADMVNKETMHSYSTDQQYGIEYRIRHKDGHYIHVYDIGKKMITPDNKEVIICVIYDMTEEEKLKRVLMQEASYDALTGLYNRRGMDKQLEQLFSEPEKLGYHAMIMIDADGLKVINDTYGHEKGDVYLKKIASVIDHFGIRSSVAARQGGDEYVLFLYDYESEEELIKTIETLEYIQNHSTAHLCDTVNVPLKFSMGHCMGNGKTGYRELLKEADKKMYQNKAERKKA